METFIPEVKEKIGDTKKRKSEALREMKATGFTSRLSKSSLACAPSSSGAKPIVAEPIVSIAAEPIVSITAEPIVSIAALLYSAPYGAPAPQSNTKAPSPPIT